MRRRRALAAGLVVLLAAAAFASALLTGSHSRSSTKPGSLRQERSLGSVRARTSAHRPSTLTGKAAIRELGQLIVSRYDGIRPPAKLLRRIGRHQVGGVILFAGNTAGGPVATKAAIATLQQAARRGGVYPLLIMADQEGGAVKRLPSLPPSLAPAQMRSTSLARAEGLATGRALRNVGINVDLAPVADVERAGRSFLGSRSFGSQSGAVAMRACAFASGLRSAGVAYTLKHFPGLGRASASTDLKPVSIGASRRRLREDYGAYRRCGHGGLALVMVSSAIYPKLTRSGVPAVLSREIYGVELRRAGIHAVTISDDLDAAALAGLHATATRAIDAGLDMLLYAGTESSSALAYAKLRARIESGSVSRTRIAQAAAAVRSLRRALLRARR